MRNPKTKDRPDTGKAQDHQQVSVRVRPTLAIGVRAVQDALLRPATRGRLARQLELLLTGFAELETGMMEGATLEILGELLLMKQEDRRSSDKGCRKEGG